MADWTSGYVADIGYTYGYYRELNPQRLPLVFLSRGLAPPKIRTACELGYGQGISVNFHSAASDVQWHGTDFNPAQASYAMDMAQASGATAALRDDAFEDYLTRPDLPDFDYIGLHGIWSWISAANRALVTEFIKKKLKPGGVLYLSYNTLPGWNNFAPIRHLLTEHREYLGADGLGILHNINAAIDFASQLLGHVPKLAASHPGIAERTTKLRELNTHYLAHEYFNRDWTPMYFADLAETLSEAKLQFCGSAHLMDQVDMLNLTEPQRGFLNGIPDSVFRESVRDYMTNQTFRRDYWVKGARQLSRLEQAEHMRDLRILLSKTREDCGTTINTPLGEATLGGVYGHLLDALSDHQPKTLGVLEDELESKGVTLTEIFQAVLVLSNDATLDIVQSEAEVAAATPKTEALNLYLFNKARSSNDVQFLVSPVTGGGVSCSRFEQLFVASAKHGRESPDDWANEAWQILQGQGQQIVRDGSALTSPEDNVAELLSQATAFRDSRLAIMRALAIL